MSGMEQVRAKRGARTGFTREAGEKTFSNLICR